MNLQSLYMLMLGISIGIVIGIVISMIRFKYVEKQNCENERHRKEDFRENFDIDLSDRK